MSIHLERLEIELKKRLNLPYRWGKKQSDDWDKKTKFIYEARSFAQLRTYLNGLDEPLKNYALNRWLNFWSAMGVEAIFCQHARVKKCSNPYDKWVDFYIDGLAFDHKTTIFPKGFSKPLSYAQNHKQDLIQWLYDQQSQESRKHHKNRLFVVLYRQDLQHYRLKAEIKKIQTQVLSYLDAFNPNQLIALNFDGQMIYSDIIWVID